MGVGSCSETRTSTTVVAVPEVTVLLASTWAGRGLVPPGLQLDPWPSEIPPASHLCIEDPGVHQ